MSVLVPQPLDPIGLDELVDRAPLQTRIDRKYVLDLADATRLATILPPDTRVLEADGHRDFGYASVYFDTPSRDAYLTSARGRRRRFKVRTRRYADTDTIFLEVKTRQGRFSVKERLPYHLATALTPDASAFVDKRLAVAGVAEIAVETLKPVLTTAYTRITLFLPESASRVTLDSGLSFSTSIDDRAGATLSLPDVAIVETKTTGLPCAVDRLLWSLAIRPTRVSKYGTGLAAIHPELPHSR